LRKSDTISLLAIIAALALIVFGTRAVFAIRHEYRIRVWEARRPKTGSPFLEGDAVAAAIENYRTDHKKYPASLRDIIPNYIQTIPKPHWGTNEWVYLLNKDQKSYALIVKLSKGDYIGHVYENGKWSYDQ
jgi:hypothetical protein